MHRVPGPVAVFQVYVLEMTLGAGGANWVIPVYTGMLVIMSAVQSGIVLEEFELLPDWKLALGAGVAVALVGLGVLGGSQNKRAVAKENLEKSRRGAARPTSSAPASTRRPPSSPTSSPPPTTTRRASTT